MKETKTLTLKKQDPLIGKLVTVQTRSPSQIVGVMTEFTPGKIIISGTERRWMPDGSLSAPIVVGTFTFDRNAVLYIAEAA